MTEKRAGSLRMIWLEAFVAVSERDSLAAAAAAMECDASSVSRYVGRLEEWLGYLLTTHNIPLVLTERGERFAETARKVMRLLNESRADLSAATPPPEQKSGKDIDMSGLVDRHRS